MACKLPGAAKCIAHSLVRKPKNSKLLLIKTVIFLYFYFFNLPQLNAPLAILQVPRFMTLLAFYVLDVVGKGGCG